MAKNSIRAAVELRFHRELSDQEQAALPALLPWAWVSAVQAKAWAVECGAPVEAIGRSVW